MPSEEEIIFRQDIGDCTEWVITNSGSNWNCCITSIFRWKFPHPSKTWPEHPKWGRVTGFNIPVSSAYLWRDGIYKLLAVNQSEFKRLSGYYLYELKYGDKRPDGTTFHNLRFFIECKQGTWFYQIQDYQRWQGEWRRTKRCVYWPVTDRGLGSYLLLALEKSILRYRERDLPAVDCESYIVHDDGSIERLR